MKLANRVVVLTGAASGIGAAFARRFAAEGARLVLADIDTLGIRRVADEIAADAVAADLTRAQDVARVADVALTTHGRIDIWFSNAGVTQPAQPAVVPDPEVWQRMWDLHVMAHVHAVRYALPGMLSRGEGYLVQTVSNAALGMQVDKAAYSVTKHAALALGEWLATHLRAYGVRVTCFCPGPMLTPMFASNCFPPDHPAVARAMDPADVAELVVNGIDEECFLLVTEDNPLDALAARAADYEGWLRQNRALTAAPAQLPQS
jgi:NAD(P)-dependent dehydrogenase (short-subunit alcohol dehydrogenase family)